jgi:hypothetical protein
MCLLSGVDTCHNVKKIKKQKIKNFKKIKIKLKKTILKTFKKKLKKKRGVVKEVVRPPPVAKKKNL